MSSIRWLPLEANPDVINKVFLSNKLLSFNHLKLIFIQQVCDKSWHRSIKL